MQGLREYVVKAKEYRSEGIRTNRAIRTIASDRCCDVIVELDSGDFPIS